LMVPCYNEGDNLDESIPHLLQLRYPNYELIFINDGSKDNTGEIIDRWAAKEPKITALHQENQGKASALNHGLTVAKGKYVACIDGDAVLDYYALDYMVQALEKDPKYAATTGNPRVRNRSTILGRLQVSEFSSIIGLIKRAQGLMGTIFTVSGVCCLFRKDVMDEIGGWSTNMITEDIDISWKIQIAGYNIMYEPRALCWVLMPESMKGLYKQRLRWAQGGAETIMKYFPQVWHWRNRR
ncbi:poly-beta-1,6-N-acetyl-D-glucosamine synthase, partial [Aggregatibacter kilianii]|uniref:poly-beta-1,6-N-acetyl-D-glucosamine synthase n=1 Tax=Aggregatibacter kilianii TaxID=2025884 RepID=UPI000D648F25